MARWSRARHLLVPFSLTVLLSVTAQASAQERFHPALNPRQFPVPPSLEPNIEFWRGIFSRYSSTQTVIHDNRHLDVVFAVVAVDDLVRAGESAVAIEVAMRNRVEREVARYGQVLRHLAGDARATAEPSDVARVRSLYARSARRPSDFAEAATRVRGQRGLRDRFAEAIATSGLFIPGIERILTERGLPLEIRCLPFVESMFNYQARSKVGASGVWQFTADTGRRYMRIDRAVDSRHDVWLAANAAAQLLASNYALVGSWPLALTGYNHGIAGMVRAKRILGTSDMGVIAERYSSRSFGFASRNFYAEFVAAVTVYEDRATLFPGVLPKAPLTFDEFRPARFVSMLDLASLTRVDVADLTALNPALSPEVVSGRLLVPSGYPLRVPAGRGRDFDAAFVRLPAERKPSGQPIQTHRVARGETLAAIAQRYDTTVANLREANRLSPRSALRAGHVLTVGAGRWSPLVWTSPTPPVAPSTSVRVHVVRAGETLYQIATRYGLTTAAISAANQLVSPDRLAVGMQIAIPLSHSTR